MRTHSFPSRSRARLLAASLLLALAGVLVHAGAASAQAVPTLAGAALVADAVNAGQTFAALGACDRAADSTFTFEASGSASGGDVSGTFTETGTVTLGPAPFVGPQPVTAFEASFTLHTANGYTITGTKRLAATRSANCRPDGPEGRLVNFSVDLEYEAAITGPGGFFSVSGTATARGTDAEPGTAFPDGLEQFQQTFITSTPIELGPVSLVLNPPETIQAVETEHCVRATVRNVFGHPVTGGVVRFAVTGASNVTGSDEIESGEARFCYTGPSEPGSDVIRAFADANGNGAEDSGEPANEATAIWNPIHRPPASLVLAPATAVHPVGAEHCVMATVLNTIGGPSAGVRVQFAVLGDARPSGSAPTGADGTASFCYTGPATPGTDTIRAFADVDEDGQHDTGEPLGTASATFEAVARPPASVTVAPATGTTVVGDEHCVTAAVRDGAGGLADPVVVRFAVAGASDASGSTVTDEGGTASFCYTGPAFPGTDAIRAFADTDADGLEGPGEPAGTASATFVLPETTPGCSVTFGGRVDAGADKATFAGTAVAAAGGPRGQTEHSDHGAALGAKSEEILAVACNASRTSAVVFGVARLEDGSTARFRLAAADVAEPGAGTDRYAFRLDGGYDTDERVLEGGNVQVRLR